VLSYNTGHKDLAAVADDAAAVGTSSLAVSVGRSNRESGFAGMPVLQTHGLWEGVEGWEETDPLEVAKAILALYDDYADSSGPYAEEAVGTYG
jgi:hypothetical protein